MSQLHPIFAVALAQFHSMAPMVVPDPSTFDREGERAQRIADAAAEEAERHGKALLDAIQGGLDPHIHDPTPSQWHDRWTVSDEVADYLASVEGHTKHAQIARLLLALAEDRIEPADRIAAQALIAGIRLGYEARCIQAAEDADILGGEL